MRDCSNDMADIVWLANEYEESRRRMAFAKRRRLGSALPECDTVVYIRTKHAAAKA